MNRKNKIIVIGNNKQTNKQTSKQKQQTNTKLKKNETKQLKTELHYKKIKNLVSTNHLPSHVLESIWCNFFKFE